MIGFRNIPNLDDRLKAVVDGMLELSVQTDPQKLVEVYGRHVEPHMKTDGFMSISRRGLQPPNYRITRFYGVDALELDFDPWKHAGRLPIFSGGFIGELLYDNKPAFIDDLDVPPNDPIYPYLASFRSAVVIPHYDTGVALNMVIHLLKGPNTFDAQDLPELVWMSNLFGRNVNNLVLQRDLKKAYNEIDREMQVVADIQRSLLPTTLPEIPTLRLAASYHTSKRAGGDYYDFFPLDPQNGSPTKWGIFIADVSGHGTPAAVVMAMTHSLAHAYSGPHNPPGKLLRYLNDKLCTSSTIPADTFITAFYGVYDPANRTLTYASAGHPPPRFRRGTEIRTLDGARTYPLGIDPSVEFEQDVMRFEPGDLLMLFTDGIVEAFSASGEMYGNDRLDQQLLACGNNPQRLVDCITETVESFSSPLRPEDDRTVLALAVS